MSPLPSVYLAGPIAGKTFDDAVGWRDEATAHLHGLGYDVYSPMRASRDELAQLSKMALEEDKFTFERDAFDIERADIVLVNWIGRGDVVSIGTAVETGLAHAKGKFIITVIEPAAQVEFPLAHDGKYHPFITGPSNIILHSLDAALLFLETTLPVRPAKVELPTWDLKIDWGVDPVDKLGDWPGMAEQAPFLTSEAQQEYAQLEAEVDES